MKHNYTLNFLVKYLYGETPILQKLEIENAIQEDVHVKTEYTKLRRAFKMLPKVSFYPKDETTQKILQYSQGLNFNASLN
ncbi:MAG: hypothetical protein HKO66_04205 [Saprospiraceae bacterium]|nr:hypothetical protein [Saprospiraceae bacterium]